MTTIKSTTLNVGDIVITNEGDKIRVTVEGTKAVAGDIVQHVSGSITHVLNDGNEEVLLDVEGKLTPKDRSDDKSTITKNEKSYDGFWHKLFGIGTASQDSALLEDRGNNAANSGTLISITPSTAGSKDQSTVPVPLVHIDSSKEDTRIETGGEAAQTLLARLDWTSKTSYSKEEMKSLLNLPDCVVDEKTKNSIRLLISDQKEFDKFATAFDRYGNQVFTQVTLQDYKATFNVPVPLIHTDSSKEDTKIETGGEAAQTLLARLDWTNRTSYSKEDMKSLLTLPDYVVDKRTKNSIRLLIGDQKEFDKFATVSDRYGNHVFTRITLQNYKATFNVPAPLVHTDSSKEGTRIETGGEAAQTLIARLDWTKKAFYSKADMRSLLTLPDYIVDERTKNSIRLLIGNQKEYDKFATSTDSRGNQVFTLKNLQEFKATFKVPVPLIHTDASKEGTRIETGGEAAQTLIARLDWTKRTFYSKDDLKSLLTLPDYVVDERTKNSIRLLIGDPKEYDKFATSTDSYGNHVFTLKNLQEFKATFNVPVPLIHTDASKEGTRIETGGEAAQTLIARLDWTKRTFYSKDDLKSLLTLPDYVVDERTKNSIRLLIGDQKEYDKFATATDSYGNQVFTLKTLREFKATFNVPVPLVHTDASKEGTRIETAGEAAQTLIARLDWTKRTFYSKDDLKSLLALPDYVVDERTKNSIRLVISDQKEYDKFATATDSYGNQVFTLKTLQDYKATLSK